MFLMFIFFLNIVFCFITCMLYIKIYYIETLNKQNHSYAKLIMLKIQLCITGINNILNINSLNNISLYYYFDCIFDQINAALVSRRDKNIKNNRKTFEW